MTSTQMPPAPQQEPIVRQNGQALASLILGIVSLVVNVLLIPSLLGLIFGIIGLTKSRALGRKGMAITGMILSVVGVIVGIVVFTAIMAGVGGAAKAASDALVTPVAVDGSGTSVGNGSQSPDDQSGDNAATDSGAADLPAGYKALSDDVWFKWGKTDDSNQFVTSKSATVIAPNGCKSLLIEANEYDKSETNVGSTYSSASNLAAGDKAKLKFVFTEDDAATIKVSDVTCI